MKRVIDRFDAYMASVGLNDNKVTVQLNLTNGLIGKSRKPGRDLSRSVTEKILTHYTDLNSVWLLTGEGPMLTENESAKPSPDKVEESGTIDRLLSIIEGKESQARMLLAMIKEKDEQIEELRRELDARKKEAALSAKSSSAADAV